MEQRWRFMLPWCEVLHRKIKLKPLERTWSVWAEQKYRLEVSLPMRCHFTEDSDGEEFELDMEWSGEDYFQDKFCQVREALALLAAVAHVDQLAWKYLLKEHCGVHLGKEGSATLGRDLPAEYYLVLDQDEDVRTAYEEDHSGLDLVLFCGTDHQRRPAQGYLETLGKIAALDAKLKSYKPGVEIIIPVQSLYPCHAVSSDGGPKILKNILRAEQVINEMWKSLELGEVPPGQLRCTFVLKPLVTDLEEIMGWTELATKVGKLMTRGLCFSDVSLRLERNVRDFGSERESRKVFGQIMAHLFGSTRRSRELMYPDRFGRDSDQHQLDLLILDCDPTLLPVDLHAMASAMVVNQTTRNLVMQLMFPLQPYDEMTFDREITTHEWWQWIAYAFFSKRARECSSLKSLTLGNIRTMCFEDMREAFTAILNSEHPEEELFECPRGRVDERDATLKANAPIRWEFNDRGELVEGSSVLTFPAATQFVRTFSDDGSSEWVNVIMPGFGRCQVQRSDLEFPNRVPLRRVLAAWYPLPSVLRRTSRLLPAAWHTFSKSLVLP